jgi:RNA polymerase sigma-70 factor (ECF subfamily)
MTDWAEILGEYGDIVWRTVRRLLDDDADAGDCFQETFVAALEFSRNHPVRNWPGLLKRLATARALDQLRKRIRTSAVQLSADDALANNISCPRKSPSTMAEQNELFDQLRNVLAAMPPDQAEVCCLRFLENLSYEQIAEELGLTVNHVGVLLHRVKSLLRVRLAAFAPVTHYQAESET